MITLIVHKGLLLVQEADGAAGIIIMPFDVVVAKVLVFFGKSLYK